MVNNAGIGQSAIRPDAEVRHPGIEELTPEMFDRFFDIFVRAPVTLVRAALPLMRERGFGRIVNNTTSYLTMLRVLPYGAAKVSPGTELTMRGHAAPLPPPVGEDTRDWPASQPISAEAVHTSCPQGTEESAETLARYRAIWDAAGIDSYDYTLQILGMFLGGTYHISVVDGDSGERRAARGRSWF